MSDAHFTNKRVCGFAGCGLRRHSNGLCVSHDRQRRNRQELSPLHLARRKSSSAARVQCDEVPCQVPGLIGMCHVFRGSKDRKGYGMVWVGGKLSRVHRYIWEKTIGPIPEGMLIDHQCRNRGCCNEDHLRVVTPKVNSTENVIGSAWQIWKSKTHCPKGHEYSEANTYRDKKGRQCKTCKRSAVRAWRARQREKS